MRNGYFRRLICRACILENKSIIQRRQTWHFIYFDNLINAERRMNSANHVPVATWQPFHEIWRDHNCGIATRWHQNNDAQNQSILKIRPEIAQTWTHRFHPSKSEWQTDFQRDLTGYLLCECLFYWNQLDEGFVELSDHVHQLLASKPTVSPHSDFDSNAIDALICSHSTNRNCDRDNANLVRDDPPTPSASTTSCPLEPSKPFTRSNSLTFKSKRVQTYRPTIDHLNSLNSAYLNQRKPLPFLKHSNNRSNDVEEQRICEDSALDSSYLSSVISFNNIVADVDSPELDYDSYVLRELPQLVIQALSGVDRMEMMSLNEVANLVKVCDRGMCCPSDWCVCLGARNCIDALLEPSIHPQYWNENSRRRPHINSSTFIQFSSSNGGKWSIVRRNKTHQFTAEWFVATMPSNGRMLAVSFGAPYCCTGHAPPAYWTSQRFTETWSRLSRPKGR